MYILQTTSKFLRACLLLGFVVAIFATTSFAQSENHKDIGFEVSSNGKTLYSHSVLGLEITYDTHLSKFEDQYLTEAYGFTLMDMPADLLVLRVGMLYELSLNQLETRIQQLLSVSSGITIQRSSIQIDDITGVMLAPVPGITENTYVYVTANQQIYEIIYGSGFLDPQGQELLESIRFVKPTQSLENLHLIHADDVIQVDPPGNESTNEEQERSANNTSGLPDIISSQPSFDFEPYLPVLATAPGCVDFPTWKYLQTQWGSAANSGTGISWAGPSYFGQGSHVDCNSSNSLNDYYDLDHALNTWDNIYPPATGTVLYAGWASGGWCSLGRIVVIDLGNGYKSLAAHLRSVNTSAGNVVSTNTLIGRAGGSGCAGDGVWSTHLHQGRYLNATLQTTPTVGVYGGQSAQLIKVYYSGGNYWYITNGQQMRWRP